MKKISILVLSACFAFSVANAQSPDFRIVASADAGASLTGLLFNLGTAFAGTDVTASSTPTIQGGVDIGVAPWFSVGVASSYQSFDARYTNYMWEDTINNVTITEDFTLKASRFNVGVRALFHYANKDKFDLYSGLVLGFAVWNVELGTTDPDFRAFDVVALLRDSGKEGTVSIGGALQAPSIIPFGARYFFTENIGVGFETQLGGPIGTPYYISAGIRGRF